jgi:hypothetical protein
MEGDVPIEQIMRGGLERVIYAIYIFIRTHELYMCVFVCVYVCMCVCVDDVANEQIMRVGLERVIYAIYIHTYA